MTAAGGDSEEEEEDADDDCDDRGRAAASFDRRRHRDFRPPVLEVVVFVWVGGGYGESSQFMMISSVMRDASCCDHDTIKTDKSKRGHT